MEGNAGYRMVLRLQAGGEVLADTQVSPWQRLFGVW
jgi:hypothetical protein